MSGTDLARSHSRAISLFYMSLLLTRDVDPVGSMPMATRPLMVGAGIAPPRPARTSRTRPPHLIASENNNKVESISPDSSRAKV